MYLALTAAARLMEAGLDWASTGVRAGEMTAAAGLVISERVALMAAAAQDPLNADHVELGRMIPEKIAAFSKAGTVLFDAWWALQRDVGDYFLYVGGVLASGRPPSPDEIVDFVERSTDHGARLAAGALGAAGAALAPVHASTMANARRLRRRARRA
jgi:hypothetical protein